MLTKKIIITLISIVIISFLTYLLWRFDMTNEYSSFVMFFHFVFSYLIAFVSGIMTLVKRPFNIKNDSSLIFYNFIGTFNICIGIVGGLFIYIDNGNKFTGLLFICLIPFIIGLTILEGIYFGRQKNN